jgi:hypothetical protein
MSNAEDISSTILSNVDIIANIYSIIKDAGLRTVENDEVKAVKSNTTIIKANLSNVNRVTKNCRFPKTNDKECRTSKQYSIDYNAADIMIVGGAALNLYDYLLTSFKGRHSMTALEDYIKKKTSDIDIVWWPRSVTNISTGHLVDNEIVTSSSPAITKLVYVLRNEIASGLEEKKSELQAKLKEYVPGSKNTDILTIEVGGDRYEVGKPAHTWKAGSWTIAIKFTYGDKVFKICEVLVHDSGASQLYDENGNIITDLRYMAKDPVYCSPNQSMPNHISWLNINGTDIGVPNVLSFVKQQMLAFSNNMTKNKDDAGNWNFKGFINYKRVEFIKKLLENIKLNDNSNISDLAEVFKTTNTEYPARIVSQINQIENMNIERLNDKIIQLCEHYNSSADPIISELCQKADGADLKEWISTKVTRLSELTVILRNQYKMAPTSEFRRAYSDLERKADNFRLNLQKLTPRELKNHNYYKGEDPVLIIEREKANIDRDLASRKINRKPQNVRVDNAAKVPKNMMPPAKGDRGILGESPYPTASRPVSMGHSFGDPVPTAMYARPPPPPPPTGVYPPQSQMPALPFHPWGPPPQQMYNKQQHSYGPPPPPPPHSYGPPPPPPPPPPHPYSYGQMPQHYGPQMSRPIPIIPIYTNDRGNPYYIDPDTGDIVVRNPYTGLWERTGRRPAPGGRKGKGKGGFNRTFKNKQNVNNTRKNN